ncbi:hypothetical protein PV783_16440 [Chitinophaga sp. CC14]|uniref:hypothetical protein n=1 Tax=Chitinophaga TaxID=79328 RepID=UPI000DBA11B1|nr:hypothetical protein [Chitinophaga ginsengisegetis]MDR6568736.1 hypothetical protein [Chitinophaga ginsengisegetis]MDR6648033.1 hypothetical protein [Chitinophaga ginsengisegetis]MDR6654817.1 hypothetical protein [Chitinophaga ginsengisegetis]
MKNTVLIIAAACLTSCTSIRLTIPDAFRQQATMQHVKGARGNKMSFDHFMTSRIKRGIHLSYPGWGGRGFFLENLLWNKIGIQKSESVTKEKAKFSYTLSDGNHSVEVYADEKEVTKKLEYEVINGQGPFSGFEQLQQYKYVFSALIGVDTTQESKNWELLMTNIYDRKAENDKNPFTYIRQEDNGLATNGIDTIFIKPLSIKNTALPDGKTGKLPFKLLSGYELSTSDGVVAIIDMIDRNIWFYNELDATGKLNISAIATAILARKVHDAKW